MIEMLHATAMTLAEESINRLLARDPVTLDRLAGLGGKVIAVQLSIPALSLYLLPNSEGLQIQSVYEGTADVTLSGGPSDFIRLLTSREKNDALFGNGVGVSGDSGLATRLQQILADTHIDWEGMLGDLIGDLPAHQASNLLRWKFDSYRRTGSSFIHNLEEYLTEEARMLPTAPEVNGFLQDVDQLRERLDRLSARVQALQP